MNSGFPAPTVGWLIVVLPKRTYVLISWNNDREWLRQNYAGSCTQRQRNIHETNRSHKIKGRIEMTKEHSQAAAKRDGVRADGIVVTGATGFVGGELLKRLLRRTDDRPIVCLVRASSDEHACDRGHSTLTTLLGRNAMPHEVDRIEWIRSDLEEVHLGWSSQTWRRIAQQTNEIFHCAASVSFDLPLDEAHHINVTGTIHVHELALTAQRLNHKFKRFHHVSTAYVSGRTTGKVDANFLPADRASNFRNTYERTKARAERYLRESTTKSGDDRVPVSIYRPSIVGGDTLTGITTNWNVLYVPMKMTALGRLPQFPRGGQALVDSVGVDVVVDAMLALSEAACLDLHAFHLTAGPTTFTVDDLLGQTADQAEARGDYAPSRTKLVTITKWKAMEAAAKAVAKAPKAIGKVQKQARIAVRSFSKCSVYVPYTMVSTVFENSSETALLKQYGVVQPDGMTYLDTIIGYALETKFGVDAAASIESVTRPMVASPMSQSDTFVAEVEAV